MKELLAGKNAEARIMLKEVERVWILKIFIPMIEIHTNTLSFFNLHTDFFEAWVSVSHKLT